MKLKKITAALLCMLLVIINGCRKNIVVEELPKDLLSGNITIWSSRENADLLRFVVTNYNKIHSKVQINIVEIESNELLDKFQMEKLPEGSIPDILCVDDEVVQGLLNKQASAFEDTGDDLKKENYLRYKLENLSFEGKLLGFPFTVKPAVMIFRKDAVEKKGINLEYMKTWEDYNGLKLSSALPFQDERLCRVLLNQLAGSYFDKEGNLDVNSSKIFRAFEVLKSLYNSGTIKNVKTFEETLDLFKKGDIDSALVSSENLGRLYREIPDLKTRVQVVKPPTFEEGGNQAISMGGSNLLLVNTSKSMNLIMDFVKFAAENRDNLKSMMSELEAVPAYAGYNDEKGFGIKLYLELAEKLNGINYTSNFSKVRQPILEAQSNIIKGQDMKNTLDELQKNLSILVK